MVLDAEPSPELRALYLDEKVAGTRWLLDPEKPAVLDGLRAANGRKPGNACDPMALHVDLPDLLVLLTERHFGLGTEVLTCREEVGAWAESWRARLASERPSTWGTALGADMFHLRQLLGDNHTRAVGEDSELVRDINPRAGEPMLGREAGPSAETRVVDGVLCIRLREFGSSDPEQERLIGEWSGSHADHFEHDRIVVDVRSNPGGSDEFIRDWIADHIPAEVIGDPANREWQLDGRKLVYWNHTVDIRANAGTVPERVLPDVPIPAPGARLTVVEEPPQVLRAGAQPWRGRMLVLTDRLSASAAEGAAFALRTALGARVAGMLSSGMITFGDVTPYLLPRSGLVLGLPSLWFGFTGVEMVGFPVDIELDPRTPLDVVARDFDQIYESG